jgi:hypothetical protein
LNIRELTQAKIDQYFNEAFASLKRLSVNAQPLLTFAQQIAERQR